MKLKDIPDRDLGYMIMATLFVDTMTGGLLSEALGKSVKKAYNQKKRPGLCPMPPKMNGGETDEYISKDPSDHPGKKH